MLTEESVSPIAFVAEWSSIDLKNVWLLFFANISRKLSPPSSTTSRFLPSLWMNTSLVNPLGFQCHPVLPQI